MTNRVPLVQVCPFTPAPPTDGGRTVLWHRLARLADRFDIHLVCPCDEPAGAARAELEADLRGLGLASVTLVPTRPPPRGRATKTVALLRDLAGSTLSAVRSSGLSQVADAALRTAAAHGAATVVVEMFHTALPLLGRLPAGSRLLAVEQNVESRLMGDLARFRDQSWLRRGWAANEARKSRLAARRVYPLLAKVGFLSSADLQHYRALAWNDRLLALPVLLPPPPRVKTDFGGSRRIAFFGTLGFYPNTEGLLWFLRDVWPRVRQRHPDAGCVIPADPREIVPRSRRALDNVAAMGVEFHPGLPRADADALIARCDACVSPIRLGSGIKIKNLVAMGLGMPLVATPESLAGIAAEHERHCLVAGSAAAFSESIARLLDEEPLRRRLGENARRWFDDHCASPDAVESWVRFLAEP